MLEPYIPIVMSVPLGIGTSCIILPSTPRIGTESGKIVSLVALYTEKVRHECAQDTGLWRTYRRDMRLATG